MALLFYVVRQFSFFLVLLSLFSFIYIMSDNLGDTNVFNVLVGGDKDNVDVDSLETACASRKV